jgi:flagellar biosynthesis GTPase FlhF
MNPYTNPSPSSAVVRKFRAADPRSALEAVKAALGDEAIILATREVSGGLFGRRARR